MSEPKSDLASAGGLILRVWADFNGLFGDVLCLSHTDHSLDEAGKEVTLREGMQLAAFMEDLDDDGKRDDLIASGVVQRAPSELARHGSKWVLKIDQQGVRHQSEVNRRVPTP